MKGLLYMMWMGEREKMMLQYRLLYLIEVGAYVEIV